MPRKIFAVTNVKIDGTPEGWFPAGSVIDRSKFTDAQLLELHENGAIEVRVVDEDVAPDGTAVDEVTKSDEDEPKAPEAPNPENPESTSTDQSE